MTTSSNNWPVIRASIVIEHHEELLPICFEFRHWVAAADEMLPMSCSLTRLALTASLTMLLAFGAQAGGGDYERTYPPRIVAAAAAARSFYAEFRARNESGGLGHSYITLGTIAATGEMQETVVAGFMPKSADDDYWAQFGIRVTGLVGVVRSDFIRGPADVRFRIRISKVQYYRVVNMIYRLQTTLTTYELLAQNCNSFVSEIANSLGLRSPIIVVQYPVHYIAELRALNSP